MEELKEKIARALCYSMYGVPGREYNKLHNDSKEELRISAAAALRAIEEAGFAIVPKEPVAWRWASVFNSNSWCLGWTEPERHDQYVTEPLYASALNLEEPRG